MSAPMLPTMAPWALQPMLVFDTETTGVDIENDRIVTAALVSVNDGPTETSPFLFDPGIDIPAAATQIHGITTDYAQRKGTDPAEGVDTIARAITDAAEQGTPLVAMNARFDLSILDRECRRYGLRTLSDHLEYAGVDLYVIDPMVLDRHLDKWRKGKRTLSDLVSHYGIDVKGQKTHDAAGDCVLTARVAWAIAKKYEAKVAHLPLPVLMSLQVAAHAEWAAGFAEYLRKQGKDDVISRHWPIEPFGGAA